MNFEKGIKEIEKKIGYEFRDKSLLRQAFTRTSYCNEHRAGYQSNEVLEFFGDSILSAAIVTLFTREFSERYEHGVRTKLAEGDFTVIRSKLSDKKNLSERIRTLGIQKYLRMGEGDLRLGVADEPSVMEDLFESIIGAVYIDTGMDMPRVIEVVAGLLDVGEFLRRDTVTRALPLQSSKNQLQEWCADKRRRLPPPTYKTVGESGPEHKKIYERACYIGDKLYAVGTGKNLKAADVDAAQKTLDMLVAEEKRDNSPAGDGAAISNLKEYAKSKKLTSPEFRDLGETGTGRGGVPEYSVMCSFDGHSAVGRAADKSTARALAAGALLSEILPKPKEKKPVHHTVKKKISAPEGNGKARVNKKTYGKGENLCRGNGKRQKK